MVSIAVVFVLALIGAWTAARLEVTTEITHFLPEAEDRELARIARDMSSSDLNRTITLTVAGQDVDRTLAAARDLSARIERLPDMEWVRAGPGEDLGPAYYDLYFGRRLLFYTSEPSRRDLLDDARLGAAARDLRERLTSPTGSFVRQIAPGDPLLAFVHQLEAQRAAQRGGLSAEGGQFVTPDRRHAVIFAGTRASPFDSVASRRVVDGIDAAIDAVRRAHGAELEIEQSGVHRIAVASEETVSSDVARISAVSTVAVILLFLVLFRSLRYLVLSTLPLAAGTVVGLFVTHLVFGSVHGLALAFGSTLIGVGVDYVAHYVNHHVLEPAPGGAFATLRRMLPGLALGAMTTIGGLAGLAYTDLPGIRALAVLASTGVLAALLATCVLVPPWMPERPRPTRIHASLARALSATLELLARSRVVGWAVPIAALIVCAVGLPRLRWVDDMRALNAVDPALLAEDERVRARVTRMDAGCFVLAWGTDEESALAVNDAVYQRVEEAREAGEVEGFLSLHPFLWSERAQRASLRAVTGSPQLFERTIAALEREGFVGSAFEPFRAALAERPEPLRWEELSRSPLGPLVSRFRIDASDGRVAFVTLLRHADVPALEQRLDGVRGARLFDQTRFLTSAYGHFRVRTFEMTLIGLIAVFGLIYARYRRIGLALAAFVPAALGSVTALAVVALAGYEASLLHVLAMLLVLSMGEDYGVFMVEAYAHRASAGNALTSVLVACLTTVLSFALLAMSQNPALRALGMMTGLGVFFSFVLAPIAWLFLSRSERR